MWRCQILGHQPGFMKLSLISPAPPHPGGGTLRRNIVTSIGYAAEGRTRHNMTLHSYITYVYYWTTTKTVSWCFLFKNEVKYEVIFTAVLHMLYRFLQNILYIQYTKYLSCNFLFYVQFLFSDFHWLSANFI